MSKTILILAIAAAFVAGTIATTGLVYAHGGNINLIHACVGKTLGLIRIVSPTTTCTNLEKPLDWSIQGPKGDKGDAGPAGSLPSIYQRVVDLTIPTPGSHGQQSIFCDSGDRAISGGIGNFNAGEFLLEGFYAVDATDTQVTDNPVGWKLQGKNISPTNGLEVAVFVLCINDTP